MAGSAVTGRDPHCAARIATRKTTAVVAATAAMEAAPSTHMSAAPHMAATSAMSATSAVAAATTSVAVSRGDQRHGNDETKRDDCWSKCAKHGHEERS